jgi:hypothetical protein
MRLDLSLLPTAGGLNEDPSFLSSFHQFLQEGPHSDVLVSLLQGETAVYSYQSLIDSLLVELIPQFKAAAFGFMQEKGNPFIGCPDGYKPRLLAARTPRPILVRTPRGLTFWAASS